MSLREYLIFEKQAFKKEFYDKEKINNLMVKRGCEYKIDKEDNDRFYISFYKKAILDECSLLNVVEMVRKRKELGANIKILYKNMDLEKSSKCFEEVEIETFIKKQ